MISPPMVSANLRRRGDREAERVLQAGELELGEELPGNAAEVLLGDGPLRGDGQAAYQRQLERAQHPACAAMYARGLGIKFKRSLIRSFQAHRVLIYGFSPIY